MVSYEIKLSATMTNQNLICDELHDFSNRQQRDEYALIGTHFGLEEAMNSFAKCRWRKSGGNSELRLFAYLGDIPKIFPSPDV